MIMIKHVYLLLSDTHDCIPKKSKIVVFISQGVLYFLFLKQNMVYMHDG
jgi:hypothetical protein